MKYMSNPFQKQSFDFTSRELRSLNSILIFFCVQYIIFKFLIKVRRDQCGLS